MYDDALKGQFTDFILHPVYAVCISIYMYIVYKM